MLRLALKLLLSAAALWTIFAFVPFGGRTLSDRWADARSPEEFAASTWAEMRGVPPAARPKGRPPARPQARTAQPPAARERASERPTEGHTEQDRRALERIVSQHLRESP
jgi:hypothetical protein